MVLRYFWEGNGMFFLSLFNQPGKTFVDLCVVVLCKGAQFFLSAKQHLGVLSFWGQESGSRTQGGHFSLATITLAADKPNVLINALTSI